MLSPGIHTSSKVRAASLWAPHVRARESRKALLLKAAGCDFKEVQKLQAPVQVTGTQ